MKEIIIGRDIDGVHLNFNDGFLRWISKKTGKRYTPEMVTGYYYWECLGETQEYWIKKVQEFHATSEGENLDAIPGAFEAMAVLDCCGRGEFITSRDSRWASATRDNLRRYLAAHEITELPVHFATKQNGGKVGVAVDHHVNVFIDDCFPTCVELAEAGIDSYLFHFKGNHKYAQFPKDQLQSYGVTPVESHEEFMTILREKYKD